MTQAFSAIGLATLLIGCATETRTRQPPPDGTPWLAEAYAVNITLLGSTCAPGGLTAEAYRASADVFQSGVTVEWAQRSEAPDAETWFLEGAICPEGDGSVLRLKGGRRDTVSGCQVIVDVPPDIDEQVEDKADDPCDPVGRTTLTVDECGLISGTIEAELGYNRNCAHRSPCLLRMRLDARPTQPSPQAPPRPDACTTPSMQ